MTLAERLKDALVNIVPGADVESLRPLYAKDMVFKDPIQTVHGIDAFLAMNKRLLAKIRHLEWEVKTAKGDDREVFLEWTMHGTSKLGPKMVLDGMTRARANADGLIVDHRDYWDLGELIASTVPGGPRILHALRSPLA